MNFNHSRVCSALPIVLTSFVLATTSSTYNDDSRMVMRMASLSPDGNVNVVAQMPSSVDDGHVGKLQQGTLIASQKVDPSPSAQITGTTFEAGREMLAAAKKESENSGSAKDSAKLMAVASTKQATDIKEAATRKIVATMIGAKKDMTSSLEKSISSRDSAIMSQTRALKTSGEQMQAAVLSFSSAKTSSEVISANEKTETACSDALGLANKTMKDFQTMSDNMHAEAARVKTVADKTAEDIEKYLANASTDIDAVADRLAEAGLEVSAKMEAKTDANEIALLVTETAQKIKSISDSLAAEARGTVTAVRSSSQEISDQIESDAVKAKTEGDNITSNFTRTINSAIQKVGTAKAAWLNADVEAMDKLSKRMSSVDEHMLPLSKPGPAGQSPMSESGWYIKLTYLFAIVAILMVPGGVLFHAYQTKT